jgi:hypothetical protein
VSRVFRRWVDFVAEHRELRVRLQRTVRQWRSRRASSVFARWAEFVAESKALRVRLLRTVQQWRNRRLAMVFDRWCDSASQSRSLRGRLARVVSHWQSRGVSRVFRRWVDFVAERRELRVRLSRTVRQWRSRVARQAFTAWLSFWEQALSRRVALARTLGHILHRRLASAWRTWARHAADMALQIVQDDAFQHRGRLYDHALRRVATARVRIALRAWRGVTTARCHGPGRCLPVAATLAVLARRRRQALLTWVVRQWRRCALAHICLRRAVQGMVQSRRRAAQAATLRRWRLRTSCAKLRTRVSRQRSRMVLRAWWARARHARALGLLLAGTRRSRLRGAWASFVEGTRAVAREAAIEVQHAPCARYSGTAVLP